MLWGLSGEMGIDRKVELREGDAEEQQGGAVEEPPPKKYLGCTAAFWVKLLLFLLFVGIILVAVLVFKVHTKIDDVLEFIEKHKVPGFFIFAGVYTLLTVFLIPGSILSIGAGFAFGLWLGVLAVWVGATIGQTLAFLVGRYFFRDWIAEKTKKFKIWQAIEAALETEGWKIVGLLRLAPLLPYNALNPALGLTAVRFWDYTIASAIAILPGTFLYVYLGSLAKSIADLTSGKATKGTTIWVAIATGVIIVVVVVVTTYYAKRAINKKLEETEGEKDTGKIANDDKNMDEETKLSPV